ncbi:hypothetical protein ACI3LX_003883 [Candidozyma auris]
MPHGAIGKVDMFPGDALSGIVAKAKNAHAILTWTCVLYLIDLPLWTAYTLVMHKMSHFDNPCEAMKKIECGSMHESKVLEARSGIAFVSSHNPKASKGVVDVAGN